MKLALVAPRFPPSFDGVGDHAAKLAHEYVDLGHDVTVLTEGPPRASGSPTVVTVGSRWGAAAAWRALATLARLRPDAILLEYTPFLFGARSLAPIVIALWARLRRIPLAIFVHEAFYEPGGPVELPTTKIRLLDFRDRLALAPARVAFVADERRRARVLRAMPGMARRLAVLPIGANVEPPKGTAWTPRAGTPGRAISFGVVMPRRRIELLIQAVADLRARGASWQLRIVGRIWDASYAAECRALAAALGLGEQVHFIESLPDGEVSREFLASDVALHAASDGLSGSRGALLAALAHGIPTIATRTATDEERFAQVVTIVEPSAASIADALIAYGAAPAPFVATGARGLDFYRRECAWPPIARTALAALDHGRPAHR